VPYNHTPVEQTWPARAALIRKAADRQEAEAAARRAEADDLDRRWQEYIAQRDADKEPAS
jgi:hypothetical protein